MQNGVRSDRSTIGHVLRNEARWSCTAESTNTTRVRGGAHPQLEQRIIRWIHHAGEDGVPVTLATIRHHADGIARDVGIPASFRCSVGWVRCTLQRHGLFTAFTEHLNAAMYAEKRHIIILLDNASTHGLIAMAKARYRAYWLRAFTADWNARGARGAMTRYRPNLRDSLSWLSDAWITISPKTIQRCWWRTDCLPAAWEMQLKHVGAAADVDEEAGDELEEELGDVGALIRHLNLGPSTMAAAEFVALDDMEPTCEEPGEDSLAAEPATEATASSWDQPIPFAGVYDDTDLVTREARRNARSACEMLIGYSRAIRIEPRDISHLFDIRNPIIVERLERASPRLDLNEPAAAPTLEPARRGRVLPAWMTTPSRRQQLINGGITAAMGGYPESAEWFRI
ncbi:unnamed protein product [Closterium sp. NIES-64]|nr:unnamed protein product [Closterium sp. NIES-64]